MCMRPPWQCHDALCMYKTAADTHMHAHAHVLAYHRHPRAVSSADAVTGEQAEMGTRTMDSTSNEARPSEAGRRHSAFQVNIIACIELMLCRGVAQRHTTSSRKPAASVSPAEWHTYSCSPAIALLQSSCNDKLSAHTFAVRQASQRHSDTKVSAPSHPAYPQLGLPKAPSFNESRDLPSAAPQGVLASFYNTMFPRSSKVNFGTALVTQCLLTVLHRSI